MKSNQILKGLFLITLITSGCASTTGKDPYSLKETTKKDLLYIKQDLSWEEKFSLAQMTHSMTLKSGKYKAYLDDRNGTYYQGEGLCLEWKSSSNSGKTPSDISNLRCGIYLPNNAKNRMIVYYYANQESAQNIINQSKPGVLIEAFSKAEMNNLKHLMYQPDPELLKSHIEIYK